MILALFIIILVTCTNGMITIGRVHFHFTNQKFYMPSNKNWYFRRYQGQLEDDTGRSAGIRIWKRIFVVEYYTK